MNFELYPDKNAELELRKWLQFLKLKRNITMMPDTELGVKKLLAYHHDFASQTDYEVYFVRTGLSIGHLVIEARPPQTGEVIITSLPQFRYWPGEPEDKIIDKPIVDE